MSNKKYALTISILASNRKDTFPKTLESIKPILDNVSSELIVTDTGCDEEMLSIIRKYTDKIVRFEWCNDFAAARNVGLKLAQGQWFMYMDDDEWFEDVQEIVDFFNSTEKDKYGYARYIIRNYKDMEGKTYADFAAGRMFKIQEGTKFVDVIHERATYIVGPAKNFSSYAHHYGYAFKSDEQKAAHRERNMVLLKKQIANEPTLARHYVHLIQECSADKNYVQLRQLAYDGIKQSNMSDINNQKDVPGLYAVVVWSYINEHNYESAIIEATKYINDTYANELCKASLYGMCATAAYNLGRYAEAVAYAKEFYKYGDALLENEERRRSMSTIILVYALDDENYGRITDVAVKSAFLSGDIDMIKQLEHCKDIPSCICNNALTCWMDNIDSWARGAKVRELIAVKQVMDAVVTNGGIHKEYFDMVFDEAMLIRRKWDNMSNEDICAEKAGHRKMVREYYKKLYKEENALKYKDMLPWRYVDALLKE